MDIGQDADYGSRSPRRGPDFEVVVMLPLFIAFLAVTSVTVHMLIQAWDTL